jgi:ElaB/YqjD/DUF883 family membrane-anchored ribosome-binding protein
MKRTRRRSHAQPQPDAAQAVRDSAQKIWLAGLGAFERAKTDGPRVFESLVEQGRNMGARAIGMADDALKNMRQANFHERMTSGKEVEALSRQVRELADSMRRFVAGAAETSKPKGAARKPRAASSAPRSRKKAAGTTGTRKKAAAKRTRKASRAPRPAT